MCSRYICNKDEAKLKLRDQILVFGLVPHSDIRPCARIKCWMELNRFMAPNASEELTNSFFRLNGCLTIPNFVVHPEVGSEQRTDADLLRSEERRVGKEG